MSKAAEFFRKSTFYIVPPTYFWGFGHEVAWLSSPFWLLFPHLAGIFRTAPNRRIKVQVVNARRSPQFRNDIACLFPLLAGHLVGGGAAVRFRGMCGLHGPLKKDGVGEGLKPSPTRRDVHPTDLLRTDSRPGCPPKEATGRLEPKWLRIHIYTYNIYIYIYIHIIYIYIYIYICISLSTSLSLALSPSFYPSN